MTDDAELKAHALSTEARRCAEKIAAESPPTRIIVVAFQDGDDFGASVVRQSGQEIVHIVRALRAIASQLEQN
jgi:hypothetical protein